MNIYLQALLNTAMGMATVFIVLILISMIISLFVYVPKLERKLRHFSIKRKPPNTFRGGRACTLVCGAYLPSIIRTLPLALELHQIMLSMRARGLYRQST